QGVIRFATYALNSPNWLGAAAGRAYGWSYFVQDRGLTSFLVDENAPPVPMVATAVDTTGYPLRFFAGNVFVLLGAQLGPQQEIQWPVDPDGRSSTRAGGTRVLFGRQECVLLSVAESKVMGLVPLLLEPGREMLFTVERDGYDAVTSPLPAFLSYDP